MTTTKKFYGYTTTELNEKPVASLAYTNLNAFLGSIIQLDGRASFDPEGQALQYIWTFNQIPVGSGLTNSSFRDIREDRAAVSFVPDKVGLYVVQLVVSDGELESDPVSAQVNIQLTRVPCGEGIVPDPHFLWSYISDFWNLVEDREIITSVWSAVIQIIGADLVTLWSNDDNKSLATIQSTVQRKWQRYQTYTDIYTEDQRIIVGNPTFGNDSGTNGTSGRIGETPGVGNTSIFYVPYGDISDADKTDFTKLDTNYGSKGRIIVINDEGFTIERVYNTTDPSTSNEVSVAIVNEEAIADGLVGVKWRVPHLLHTTGLDLEEIGARTGDILVLEVRRKDTGITAEIQAQVVGVDRNRLGFELTLEDLDTASNLISRTQWRQLVRDLRILGTQPTDAEVAAAAEALIQFIPPGVNLVNRPFSIFSMTIRAKRIIHNSVCVVDEDLISVPALQEKLYEPPVVLRENLDYILENSLIQFTSGLFTLDNPAPDALWGECNFYDNNDAVEANFGTLVGLGQDDLTASQTRAPYLSAVTGLAYALVNGPSMDNLRLGLQILLGLPFAEEDGIILELETNYSTTPEGTNLGRFLIEDLDEKGKRTGTRRIYFYPTEVGIEINPVTGVEYAVGDKVNRFAPLSKGVEVLDYIKDPLWWKSALSGIEILKYHNFKVEIDSDVFDVNDVTFALDFMNRIKPTYTNVLAVAVRALVDDIDVDEDAYPSMRLHFYDNVGWGIEATARADDRNQQGLVLWNQGSRPFSTRNDFLLRDVTTFESGGSVRASSATGWDTGDVRARVAADSPWTNAPVREGDILVIFAGQPGASTLTPGMYEIGTVVDDNEVILLREVSRTDPGTFLVSALSTTLFNYGTDLVCCIARRALNPVLKGDDLATSSSNNIVTSSSASFMTNEVGIEDHLIIESGTHEGEYRIDGVNSTVPYISETQVRLKNLDGTTPTFTNLTGIDFRVIRPIMMSNVIERAKSVYTGSRIEIEVMDTGVSPNKPFDAFTPGLVGTVVNVSNSDDPSNDGAFIVTEYIHPGKIAVSSSSTSSDTTAQAVVRLNSLWHPGFEKIDELSPNEVVQVSLKGVP